MRWAVLAGLAAFCVGIADTPLAFESDVFEGLMVAMGSGRLRAAGSMSGIALEGGEPAENAWEDLWAPAPHQELRTRWLICDSVRILVLKCENFWEKFDALVDGMDIR